MLQIAHQTTKVYNAGPLMLNVKVVLVIVH